MLWYKMRQALNGKGYGNLKNIIWRREHNDQSCQRLWKNPYRQRPLEILI